MLRLVGLATAIVMMGLGATHAFAVSPPVVEPHNEAKPEVSGGSSGEAEVGETLTCTQGSWTGTAPIAYAYKWFRSDVKESISGATTSQYQVAAEDETHELSCRVTASNKGGEETVESSNSIGVAGTPPKNFELPSVLGVDAVNETLTCDPGGWSGSPPITYGYRWFRDGTELAMETGPTYIVKGSDEGQKLRCKVIAKNSLGKAEATSGEVSITGKLKNVEPPVLTPPREAKVGTRVKCSQGTWNESASELTFEYEWLRDEDEPIGGQTTSEYVVASGDATHELSCRVFVTNAKKEKASAVSLPDSVLGQGAHPKKLTSPEVQGSPELGATLKCYEGTWSGSPTSYKFQWVREGASLGVTEQSYVVKAADQGHALACLVVAVNSEGPSEQVESPSVVVAGEAPSPVRGPEIEGGTPTPRVGESLTCLHGEWKGAPAPTFTYEWYRDGSERLAATIAYTIASADRGHSLSCVVTAKNSEAPPEGVSDSSGLLAVPGIAPEPPLSGPQIEGTPAVEQTLTCKEGTWTGQPAPEYSFQWVVNGSPVPSATTNKFKIGTADSGYNIACRVTGTNNSGSASALSKSVRVPGTPPEDIEQPFISGEGRVGAQLTCERGVWAGKPPPTFSYQWYRDDAPISGASEETYVVGVGDQTHQISCIVLAANSEGSLEQESSNAVEIPLSEVKPESTAAPEIEGADRLGATDSCTTGSWDGTPAPTFNYQWRRDGTAIAAATKPSYTLVSEDQGHSLSCEVTATNSAGATSASSRSVAVPDESEEVEEVAEEAETKGKEAVAKHEAETREKAEQESRARAKAEAEAGANRLAQETSLAALQLILKRLQEEAAARARTAEAVAILKIAESKAAIHILRSRIKARTVVVTVDVSEAGTVTLQGLGFLRKTASLNAGTHNVVVTFSRAGLTLIKAHKKRELTVILEVGARRVAASVKT
jgi:hypothetical protein